MIRWQDSFVIVNSERYHASVGSNTTVPRHADNSILSLSNENMAASRIIVI
jgi:hypothetical protein